MTTAADAVNFAPTADRSVVAAALENNADRRRVGKREGRARKRARRGFQRRVGHLECKNVIVAAVRKFRSRPSCGDPLACPGRARRCDISIRSAGCVAGGGRRRRAADGRRILLIPRSCRHAACASAARRPGSACSRHGRSRREPISSPIAANGSRPRRRSGASGALAPNTCSRSTGSGPSTARPGAIWDAISIIPASRTRKRCCAPARSCSWRCAPSRRARRSRSTTARNISSFTSSRSAAAAPRARARA